MCKKTLLFLLALAVLVGAVFTPVLGESASATRFYNPKGGAFAHRNPYCASANKKYLPLAGLGNTDQDAVTLARLKPCAVCGALPKASALLETLAQFQDIPFGTSEAAFRKWAEGTYVVQTEDPEMGGEGSITLSTKPASTFTPFQHYADSVTFTFMQDALTGVVMNYHLVDKPYARAATDALMDLYLPLFFSLLFQLEEAYGESTNGTIYAGDQYPLAYYNYPLFAGERDAQRIMRIMRESPQRGVYLIEVFGNVTLALVREHYEMDGQETVTCGVSILYEHRADFPEGSLAPFIWPNGEYAW